MSENNEGRDCPHGYTMCPQCQRWAHPDFGFDQSVFGRLARMSDVEDAIKKMIPSVLAEVAGERDRALKAARALREELLNWDASKVQPAGLEQTLDETRWLDEVSRG